MTLKEISLPISEEQYRDIECVSYSFLSSIDKLGAGAKDDKFKGSKSTQMGTFIEELIFGTFDPLNYVVSDSANVGDTLKKCIDDIVSICGVDSLCDDMELTVSTVLSLNPHIGFWEKKNADWRAEKIVREGEDYIQFLINSKDKVLLTSEEYSIGQHCANIARHHIFTKDIFDMNNLESYQQFKGRYILQGIPIKYMVDLVKIDHDKKEIWIYDLKTGAKKAEKFQESYHYFRYDIQDYIYYNGAREVFNRHFPGYIVYPMRFVYISTTKPKPLIYPGLGKHEIIEKGYRLNGKRYKGVFELIDDYKWYLKNSFNVEYPEKIYNSKGVINLDFTDVKPLNDN